VLAAAPLNTLNRPVEVRERPSTGLNRVSVAPATIEPVVTALYRRYRPETFAEMIGQSQVTEPLMTALRTNRVNHAYLFSGPRGCGKTTSARILARCLNCATGPTDTPCGTCESCIELGRGGQGSLDVVEIDAASHNGVDDARDIRERAIFAPARDRYKIFILDEAHMVTPQGFNALLKIVEEPPEHVKFIFATTEPDKVIGTIRSRTHHYPFRLVPPAQMLDYVQRLCESEGMSVAPGVLPLVVRAGGGSPRDTLSLLDQLIAGSEGASIEYERAVALLGYTHAALLDEVVDAIGAVDAPTAFAAVDRVIQTGQDPRRFVEDLLERLRDLIIVAATSPDAAAAVLRGTPQEELDRMSVQASVFGAAELSRCADIVNAALTEMTGATSPRLHLELMIARMLVPASDATDRGALARVERLERRVGVQSSAAASDAASATPAAAGTPAVSGTQAPAVNQTPRTSSPAAGRLVTEIRGAAEQKPAAVGVGRTAEAGPGTAATAATSAWSVTAPSGPAAGGADEASSGAAASTPPTPDRTGASAAESAAAPASAPSAAPAATPAAPPAPPAAASPDSASPTGAASAAPSETSSLDPAVAQAAAFAAAAAAKKSAATGSAPAASSNAAASAWATPGVTDDTPAVVVGAVTTQQVRDAWPEILDAVAESSRSAWAVVYTATVRALDGDVLSLSFPSANDVESFRGRPGAQDAASEVLRQSIIDLLGIRVKFVAKPAGQDGGSAAPAAGTPGAGTPSGRAPSGGAPRGGNPTEGGPDRSASPNGPRGGAAGATAAPSAAPAAAPSGPPASAGAASRRQGERSPARPVNGSTGRPSSSASPRTSSSARPSASTSSTSVGWATVAIPGSSTAVLDRPRDAEKERDAARERESIGEAAERPDDLAQERNDASAVTTAPSRSVAPSSASAGRSVDQRPAAFTDADAPDDDEPPFPDEYPGEPTLSSVQNSPAQNSPLQNTPDAPQGRAGAANSDRTDASAGGTAQPKASVGFREPARYGEAVVRELLGAKFIEEQQVTPPSGGGAGQGGAAWSR
jgi:DNA polymerase-3 subunit gamma/tau